MIFNKREIYKGAKRTSREGVGPTNEPQSSSMIPIPYFRLEKYLDINFEEESSNFEEEKFGEAQGTEGGLSPSSSLIRQFSIIVN